MTVFEERFGRHSILAGLLLLLVAAVVMFSLADAIQRRRFPASYVEPIDIWVGLDPELTLPKLLIRFGSPTFLGVVLFLMLRLSAPWLNAAELPVITSIAAALSAYVVVYPPLTRPQLRPYRAQRRRATTIAYLTFIAMNGALGYLGGELARVALERLAPVESGLALPGFAYEDARAVVIGVISSLIASGVWRFLVASATK